MIGGKCLVDERFEWYKNIFKQILADDMKLFQNQQDAHQLLVNMKDEVTYENPEVKKYALKLSNYVKGMAQYVANTTGDANCDDLYWKILLFEAPEILDSFCLYVEKDRKPEERFYQPRRKALVKVCNILQRLEDDELDIAFIHEPPRIGKSQIITMGTAWHCARYPKHSNLYVTYKEGLGGAYIDGVQEIYTDPTYRTVDVFPMLKIARTDAKNHKLDLERKKKYATLSGKGLESGLNGEYDAYGWLILDDILEGIQDVLNPDVLKRKQTVFDNNVMSRKKEKCKLILNGTIWSLHDIYSNYLDFLQNNQTAKHLRYDVLKIPALDPETDESNFDYDYGVGFSTEYYKTLRARFEENDDMAGWFAQYQQEPIERDGQLFNAEHMNFYNGVLPNIEPLRIICACDVALGGKDYLSMPIAYVYEDGSAYIHDVVFDNSEKSITIPRVVDAIVRNKVTNAFFEANNGGEGYKDEVDAKLKERGFKTNLVSKFAQQMILSTGKHAAKTAMRKEQRIWDNAEQIRQFYFRDSNSQNPEYRKFLNNVFQFTMNGKNKHDDAPDSLAALAVFLHRGSGAKTPMVLRSPF